MDPSSSWLRLKRVRFSAVSGPAAEAEVRLSRSSGSEGAPGSARAAPLPVRWPARSTCRQPSTGSERRPSYRTPQTLLSVTSDDFREHLRRENSMTTDIHTPEPIFAKS